jgi:hypothetical protein
MTDEAKYNQILERLGAIFEEFFMVINSIKNDFDSEKKQDPGLTMKIVDYHIGMVQKYNKLYQNRIETGWDLEKKLNYTRQNIRSFNREFDNPFLGSQQWYQKIIQLQEQLSEQARELDKLMKEENEK